MSRPLDPALLKILACPACKMPLAFDEPASRLSCSACGRSYDVRDGIPILLVQE
ncbi:MAG: Trm112 family protein [Elusimicrobia bacterium]|nr:Trm112 family protein [Elusimicrobiota bacterium]